MNFTLPDVNVNVESIKNAGETATKIARDGADLVDHVTLSNHMLSTKPVLDRPRELPEENVQEVIELVRRMNAKGCLKPEEIQWCKENNIPIK